MEFLFEVWKRKWLFAAFALGILIAILPVPEGLTRQGLIVMGISAGSMIIFITEPVPLPTVALLIAVLQVLAGIDTPKHIAQSYMSDSVFFIMGSLMIAVAFVKQKLDRRMAYLLLRITGGNTYNFALGILISAGFLASLIGEHTVAAILLPVCLIVIRTVQESEGRDTGLVMLLLFSLTYGCTIAGVGTPSGGARNAIMIQYFNDLHGLEVGYLDWIKAAYPMVIIVLPIMWFIIQFTCRPRVKRLTRVLVRMRAEVEESGSLSGKDWLTIGIFLFTLTLWLTVSGSIGLGIVALIGASLYLVTGCVEWHDFNTGVNWGAVLLYAAAMSMGAAMVKTQAASWVATNFLNGLNAIGLGSGIGLLLMVALLIAIVTNTMSSGAAVAVMAPITLQIAAQVDGMSILVMGFVTTIASAFGFISVGSHPGITIVYSSGLLPARDFLRMGWKIALVSVVVLVIYAGTYLSWVSG